MTVINASDYGILPGQECGAEIERIIKNIPRDSSEKVLYFQKGDYFINARNLTKHMLYITNTAGDNEYSSFETPHLAPAALYFESFKNLTVDGCGARFIISGKANNCVIKNCENFTLKNITFTADKPDFHSLTVKNKGNFYVDFALSENESYELKNGTLLFNGNGFEADIKSKSKTAWWINKISGENNEQNVRSRHPLALALRLKMLNKSTLRAYFISAASFKTGERYYLFDNRRQYVGIFADESKNVILKNVAQHFNYSLAFVCQCCENITLERLDFTPENGHFVTSVADFVQICMCRGKVQVTDSKFDGAGDDCLNCHGFHFKTVSVNGNTVRVKFMHPQSHGYNPFKCGDEVAFIDKSTLLETGRGTVASSKMTDEYTLELELSGGVPTAGQMLENISACPELYFARNEIHRIVTRGLLITTRGKTVVEDNHFYNCGMSGILISDDASSWFESGMCKSVTVRNNVFEYCGGHGIEIHPENKSHGGAIHKNITVTGNTFKECKKACFYAKSSSDLDFSGNEILSAPKQIQTENCENVVI